MANTYTLIDSESLSTTAASVTFSAIPATYDDLIVLFSARSNASGRTGDVLEITANISTSTNNSITALRGNGSSTSSYSESSQPLLNCGSLAISAATSTADTFSLGDVYIPKYTASQNKPLSVLVAQENNNASANIYATAGLISSTSAITSVTLDLFYGSFVSGSTFWLYGIKNS